MKRETNNLRNQQIQARYANRATSKRSRSHCNGDDSGVKEGQGTPETAAKPRRQKPLSPSRRESAHSPARTFRRGSAVAVAKAERQARRQHRGAQARRRLALCKDDAVVGASMRRREWHRRRARHRALSGGKGRVPGVGPWALAPVGGANNETGARRVPHHAGSPAPPEWV